jgi:DNA-binding PadR family transcriptional regulator
MYREHRILLVIRPEAKIQILELVARHNGEWYWYQIDRALSGSTPGVVGPFMEEINALTNEGLIEIRVNPLIDKIERYWITEAGRAALEEHQQFEPGPR